ncbi:ATP-binding protein [Methanocella sp. MCL-LM]|uniref:ATP-binding protein n=1 Tax=Methanocella sp. MCL-LM TaxID=3412035 RepID=UPI003C725A66
MIDGERSPGSEKDFDRFTDSAYPGNPELLKLEIDTLRSELRRKQAELDALKWLKAPAGSPERMFKTLFEGASTAIFIADTESGIILDCNSCAADLIGRTREEVIGMHQSDMHPPELCDFYRNQFREHTSLTSINNCDAEVRHTDGRNVPVIISARPFILDGRTLLIGFFMDITELKRADEELKAAKARAELYLDLMGHDINNLNQIALGYLELIRSQLPEGDLVEMFSRPVEAVTNSSKLIDNVRKLQKVTIGSEKIPVCTRDVVELACSQFAKLPGVCLRIDIPGSCSTMVLADELLNDVFTNLIGNAIKHRGGQDTIELNLRLVPVSCDGAGYYRFEIEDNGPGIPDDRKEQIFDRFSRSSSKSKGSGLGLYLVNSLVKSYRGSVWVEDRVPGDHTLGAKFVVMLPALDKHPQ